MNRRLKKLKFDDGALLQDRIKPGRSAAHLEAHVACAPDGNIYLTDHLESCVHEYSAAGELLNKIRTDLSGNYMVTLWESQSVPQDKSSSPIKFEPGHENPINLWILS